MFRFEENLKKWNELTTTYTGSEGDNELYDVELTSFSFFAISTTEAVTEEVEEEGGIADIVGDIAEVTKKAGSNVWVWIIIIVVVIAIIAARMKKRKQ